MNQISNVSTKHMQRVKLIRVTCVVIGKDACVQFEIHVRHPILVICTVLEDSCREISNEPNFAGQNGLRLGSMSQTSFSLLNICKIFIVNNQRCGKFHSIMGSLAMVLDTTTFSSVGGFDRSLTGDYFLSQYPIDPIFVAQMLASPSFKMCN